MQTVSRQAAAGGVLLTTLFWAGNAIVARGMIDDIPPITLAFWRWVVALLVILPFGLRHVIREWKELVAAFWPLAVLGLLSVSVFNTLLYLSAHSTTAINLVLVNSSLPLVTLVLSWALLAQRPHWNEFVGIALATLGLVIVLVRGDYANLLAMRLSSGDTVMLAAVFSWALYSVLLTRWPLKLHVFTMFTTMMVIGVVALLPFYWVEYRAVGGIGFTGSQVAIFVYVGVLASAAAHIFWYYGVNALGPTTTSMFTYLIPVFTVILAYLILNEALFSFHLAGGVLIFLGFVISTVMFRRARPD
ncbi:MAG: EamA family transporter [Gammaproteobacteria bacterium]|nr:EamA family transporter [Gammaproteobacteria bacterium]